MLSSLKVLVRPSHELTFCETSLEFPEALSRAFSRGSFLTWLCSCPGGVRFSKASEDAGRRRCLLCGLRFMPYVL